MRHFKPCRIERFELRPSSIPRAEILSRDVPLQGVGPDHHKRSKIATGKHERTALPGTFKSDTVQLLLDLVENSIDVKRRKIVIYSQSGFYRDRLLSLSRFGNAN